MMQPPPRHSRPPVTPADCLPVIPTDCLPVIPTDCPPVIPADCPPHHSRRLPPVIPADCPLSFPQFLAGIQRKGTDILATGTAPTALRRGKNPGFPYTRMTQGKKSVILSEAKNLCSETRA